MNKSVICWKWEDSTLDKNFSERANDLNNRFGGDMICTMDHWIKRHFFDEEMHAQFKWYADYLHHLGKKLSIEACIRNEGEDFFKAYPSERAHLCHTETIKLDENGNADLEIDIEAVYHYWRISGENGAEKIFRAWALDLSEDNSYIEDSLLDITSRVMIKHYHEDKEGKRPLQLHYGGSTPEAAEDVTKVCKIVIKAGKAAAGKTAVIALGTPQPIPDLASPFLMEHYQKMIDRCVQTGVDGVFSDEWGYDVILKITEPNPYDDNNLFIRHISVSDNFAARYHALYPEFYLYEDLLHLFYYPEGKREVKIAAVNRYTTTLRKIMSQNDFEMYSIVKKTLGEDAFYGVHPTWWGSVNSLYFEVFKNGFYWWEAKRDIAQTDEVVTLPIRSALAHKWKSDFWYNMWYSMGTRDINTYFGEAWSNFRYGGRSHYHGYECPNEPVVLELKGEGLLESLEEMDSRIRMIEPYHKSALDCRVLLLFGMEAITNWTLSNKPLPPWSPQSNNMDDILNTAHELNNHLLCDLVPTSEIENGSLTLKNGKAVYGSQEYDAVVLIKPECMDETCFNFLAGIKENLMVYGEASLYNSGKTLSEADLKLLNTLQISSALETPVNIAKELLSRGIKANRVENGCVFQDGSIIFTAEGNKNVNNALIFDCSINGVNVSFNGLDYLYLNKTNDGWVAFSPTAGKLKVNGKDVPVDSNL